jgi:4-amino-4-deoxy-L-arabinose transferase-like glycosyltransferase
MSNQNWKYTGLALLALAVIFPVFLHLDHCGLYLWDESRNAVQAIEMAAGGNPLVRTYGGQPDHWETKPPILIWTQVVSMKLLGPSEFSIRLPSAIAGLALFTLLFLFFVKRLRDWRGGVFSVLILITSAGYVRSHVLRTGDHDALLILFLTAGLFAYFQTLEYLGSHKKHPLANRWFVVTALCLSAAVLTKSITGLFFLPGMFIYTILSKNTIKVFTSKGFYIALGVMIGLVAAYYLGRTYFDPQYLYWVNENELFKRYFNTSTEYGYNQSSPWFYWRLLHAAHFKYWVWVLPLTLVAIGLMNKGTVRWRFLIYILVNAAIFFFIVSIGTTNDWYAAPVYPMLAAAVGLALSEMLNQLANRNLISVKWTRFPVFILICGLLFAAPYRSILKEEIIAQTPDAADMSYGNYLRDIKPELLSAVAIPTTILSECENSHVAFYARHYYDEFGLELQVSSMCTEDEEGVIAQLDASRSYIICNEYYRGLLESYWECEVGATSYGCGIYRLIKPIPQNAI